MAHIPEAPRDLAMFPNKRSQSQSSKISAITRAVLTLVGKYLKYVIQYSQVALGKLKH